MKVTIIGSTQYRSKIENHKNHLESEGHIVRIPAFDDHPDMNELQVCSYNREAILWADEIHVIWDQRSSGVIFDFGMVFMAQKPAKVIYIEKKTFKNLMVQYDSSFPSSNPMDSR